MRSQFWRVGILVGLLALAVSLFGQAISGDVTGVISDKSGGAIATATVTARK